MRVGQARESPDSGYQPTEFYTNSYGAGASTFSQDPPLPATWEPPGPCLRVFRDFCAPAGKSGLPRGAGTRLRPFSLSHFVPPFLLPLPPFLFSLRLPFSPLLTSFPCPLPRTDPPPPPSFLAAEPPLPSPPPSSSLSPLAARSRPISAQRPAAPPPGGSGRAWRSPGRGCGGRRRGAGADGAWRAGGAGAGLAGTPVSGAVRARRALRPARHGPAPAWRGRAGGESGAGPGLRGGRPARGLR